ncbi:hypothetical protein [Mycolicibacterium aichiense]|uniref:Uncharacterized protein n=1 Tax=Mycolicibacterium aichiense TaxID=1799 RepID=A0A378VCZ4_9MYCO|nr:hypothetical protein [Mycolicibacterium aichiense]QFG08009.1 hypothetical protein SEA_HERBERTWM_40 [Mycobacterium phage Herbertwm]MCV7016781.1 hypothetical protein [Mycolicibacterium aichiense]SUA14001.1 Uncharacterised protein [Mycolicibacterium aichiense]SUA14421.1 Uncharacterised protein [Mycolicibacterium aichiense]BBX09436.1 hypothetical protein MAIC_42390 [Mycolicibacterium aichiense]
MTAPTWTAVFASTKDQAEGLAESLGLVDYVAYGVDKGSSQFEGARAGRTLIESGTQVPIDLAELIYATTVVLYGGRVLWVSAKDLGLEGWLLP